MVKKNKKRAKKKDKYESQLKWTLAIIGLVFLMFFSVYFYVQSLNYFEYANVNWEKTEQGDLTLYHARIKVSEEPIKFYNAYFRFDPRENNISSFIYDYTFKGKVLVSNSDDYLTCKNAIISNSHLGQFFAAFEREVDGGVLNNETATQLNLTQIDCSHANENQTVISLQKSDVPFITQNKTYLGCYNLYVGDCENVQTVEKFIVDIIEDKTSHFA